MCDALASECDDRIEYTNVLNMINDVGPIENPLNRRTLKYKRRVQKLQHLVKEAIQNYDEFKQKEKMDKERDANTSDKALGKKRARE